MKQPSKDLTQGSLWKNIFVFSIPLMLSNVLQVLFNMSDIAVVGGFAGPLALGSVGSTAILVTMFTGFLIGLAGGINVLTALYLGAGKKQALSHTVHSALIVSICSGLALLLFGICFARPVLEILHTKEELIDGIPYSDWNDYIGKAAPVYLNDYSRMQLQHTKISMCFSALVFGPFYFFYRKAWKPAFGFLAAELVVALPTLLSMMQATGSPLTAGISSTAIVVLSRIMTVFSFALVMLRTLYAKWLYRKSAAERIRRIRAEFPDAAQRRAVLSAQGGVSIAGVIGAFVLLMVLGACATVLMGPNLDALAGML